MTEASDRSEGAAILAWGNVLRAAKARRRRLLWRGGSVLGIVAAVSSSIVAPPLPRLVWNASASAPVGLYAVSPGATLAGGDMVVARLPASVRRLAAVRRYLPENAPLVKRVIGIAGDEICALGGTIYLDGKPVAVRKTVDGQRRALPAWHGCRILRGREIFLLMDAPDSFDGRYFGITQGSDVIGKAHLLWAR